MSSTIPANALVVLLLAFTAGCSAPQVGMPRGEALFDTCVPCHGADGAGNRDLGAPTIAGLPQWYLQSQLEKFRDGVRGAHPDDFEGLRMRPMAVSLKHDGDVASVAEYVASLPPVYPRSTLHGDAGSGARSYTVCVACHGAEGLGNELLGAPPIVAVDDWYLLAQLGKFKSGERGADPDDTWGATMRPTAMTLDDQAMEDVVAYIQTLR